MSCLPSYLREPRFVGYVHFARAGCATAFLHQWAVFLHPGKYIARKYWLSFADGISISYIFLQLLPEIVNTEIQTESAGQLIAVGLSGWLEVLEGVAEDHPFLPLLIGFTIFYGIEKGIQQGGSGAESEGSIHFWVHIVGLSLYKIVLGYLLASMSGLAEITIFTVAMLMHFLVIDIHLVEMHHQAYQKIGRWILTVCFLLGWSSSAVVGISPPLFAILISFMSGGAVFMIIQDEFSETHQNSFPSFLLAVALCGPLLLLL